MKILVTGSGGLVGEALTRLSKHHLPNDTFIFLDKKSCDLTSFFDINSFFDFYKPDIVIHLASKVGGLYKNLNENYSFLTDNLKIHTNIIECCKKFKVGRLINILSTCIFPDDTSYPLKSSYIHLGPPHHSNEGYAYSKRILHTLSKLSGIQTINLIPTNLYGKNDNYNLYASHVIPGLIHKMYNSKKNGRDGGLLLKGSGKAFRQFVYADDFAKIILYFARLEINKQSVDIIVSPDTDQEISISSLSNLIKEKIKFDNEILFMSKEICKEDGQQKKSTNSVELKEYYPDFQFTSLEKGLEETISYFEKNYNNLRT